MRDVVLSAIKPTNPLTLGNYLGAIRNFKLGQPGNVDCLYFIVDLHAITERIAPEVLVQCSYELAAYYLAAGLNPKIETMFVQSHVSAHAELAWVLNCFSYMGELSRMTQYKDKSAKQGQSIGVGLFDYPVLMAADILLYGAKYVPVGDDQKQHVELTRDIAIRFNNHFAQPIFTVPEPVIAKVGARIMSLQDPAAKMSKSDHDAAGSVYLNDSDDDIRRKFKRAVTDSGSEILFRDEQPGVKNLLTIQSVITGKNPDELVRSYQGKQYGHLKVDTAELVVQEVAPLRQEAHRLLADRGYIDKVLADGAKRAAERAEGTLSAVHQAVGFVPRSRA
jgi:tryptophanyl-tRNA synthetase